MKKFLCVAIALISISVLKTAAAVETNTITPWLDSVSIEPAEPAGGQDINVAAHISVDKTYSSSKILEAFLNFSTDSGKTWTEVELTNAGANSWGGVIPGQPDGTKVLFYIRSADSGGNFFTELPCDVTTWPPADDSCMVPTAQSLSAMEWGIPGCPENLEITDVRAGRDADKLFFTMKTSGNVGAGTISPFNMQSYAVIIFNSESWPIIDQFKEGWAYAYAPLLSATGYVKTDLKDGCVLAKLNEDKITFDPDPVDCAIDGKTLYMKIAKKSFGGMNSKTRIMSYIGIWNDITNFLTAPGVRTTDYTRYTLLRPAVHEFTVGGGK
jgi:hypothetical protein